MQEPAEARGASSGWVRRGPLCPSTTRERQTCPEWPPGMPGLWVSAASGYLGRQPPTPTASLFFALLSFVCALPSPADCDSYCKASKGKLKINMKKYCKKDYGE